MSPESLRRVVESFRRCRAGSDFFGRFYDRFIASSPEVAAKFEGTDFERQKTALGESLHTLLVGSDIPEDGVIRSHLEAIARRHSRAERAIRPELYDLWLDCLVATVEECDPKFEAPLGDEWRRAMQPGIAFMRARY